MSYTEGELHVGAAKGEVKEDEGDRALAVKGTYGEHRADCIGLAQTERCAAVSRRSRRRHVGSANRPGHVWPQFLPDGRHFLYLALSREREHGAIYVGSLDAKATVRILGSQVRAGYAAAPSAPGGAGGYLLFVREGTLLAQPFNSGVLQLSGTPVFIADRVTYSTSLGRANFAVSDAGVLAYRAGPPGGGPLQLVWFDRTGKELGSAGDPIDYHNLWLSPDEQRVAVERHEPTGDYDIWLFDLSRGTSSRFTFDPALEREPVWSPDGRQIVFASNRAGADDLYQKAATGAGQEAPLLKSSTDKTPTDWSSDGELIVYENVDPKTREDLWVLPLAGDRQRRPFLQTEFREREGRLSLNGRWMAYVSDETGRDEVYVQAFPSGGGKWQISTAGGIQPRWRRDGKELFYLAPDSRLMAVEVKADATFQAGVPHALFQARVRPTTTLRKLYAVGADGQRFLIISPPAAAAASPINVMVNWPARLHR